MLAFEVAPEAEPEPEPVPVVMAEAPTEPPPPPPRVPTLIRRMYRLPTGAHLECRYLDTEGPPATVRYMLRRQRLEAEVDWSEDIGVVGMAREVTAP